MKTRSLTIFFLSLMVCYLPPVYSREIADEARTTSPQRGRIISQQIGKYYTTRTIMFEDGTVLGQAVISGPRKPPPGYELERLPVALPESDPSMGIKTLPVPAFDWVFGCSAVSAAMIAGYYDRNGFPNMYTGPTDGGVMPLNNSSWPRWFDGFDSYPNLPLAASRQGVDGRTSSGSIDDYWILYGTTSDDPYITGGWTQHPWGDAIGDYMKTSQSAYDNKDGSTTFYYNYSASPLACADRFADGTYGRKLFYEARGYRVTDCYDQNTDNKYTGGFSFAQFKAEIDAGRPVFLTIEGHSIVGVGYDDSQNKIYIHDTWDYSIHAMTWGGSYAGRQLLAARIVNLDPLPVVTFSINNRAVLATSQIVILNNAVTSSTPTHYMASESPAFTGAAWYPYSDSPSFTLSPGSGARAVYFKVKNALGTQSAVVSDSIQLTAAQDGPYTTSTVPYAFEDISSTGADLPLIDESYAVVSIPFSFKFYGTAHSSVSVNSNGLIYFEDKKYEGSNKCIPDTGVVQEFIALLWDDLDPGPYGHGSVQYRVLGNAPYRRLIVQWTDVPHYFSDSGGWGTFQVILHEGSDHILFQYKDVDFGKAAHNFGMSATVGIQRDSITGIQYSCNTADLSNGFAIGFAPSRKSALDPILPLLLY